MTECGGGVSRAPSGAAAMAGGGGNPPNVKFTAGFAPFSSGLGKMTAMLLRALPFSPEKRRSGNILLRSRLGSVASETHNKKTSRSKRRAPLLPEYFLRVADATFFSFFASLFGGPRAAARSGPVMCEWTCIKVMPCMFYVLHTGNSRNAVP